jgi:hypothetical protein
MLFAVFGNARDTCCEPDSHNIADEQYRSIAGRWRRRREEIVDGEITIGRESYPGGI